MTEQAIAENPFFVLGLAPEASRAEVERTGQKLLAMLELGAAAAKTYRSPLGTHERTADLIRSALAELRDPERRIVHEFWAGGADAIAGEAGASANATPAPAVGDGFPEAATLLGWEARRQP